MKKIIIFALIVFLMVLPGCLKMKETEYDYEAGDIRVIYEEGKTTAYSSRETDGIEILLSGNAEELIEVDNNYLKIEKQEKDNTLIAIAKIGGRIKEGEQIFTANRKIEKEEILEMNSVKLSNEKTFEISSIPAGISIESKTVPVNSEGYISIYGKGINDLKGCELQITYDASYLEIDTTKGENGVERLNSMVNGLVIVQHENNKLIISSALNESVDITEEEIYRINIKTKEERVETNIGITGEARDSNKEIIGLSYTGGTIKIGREYKLLGDFDGNCSVGLIDFMNFADHYNSDQGEAEYEITYDIAPAEKGVDIWSDIYVICEPDGNIGLMDFIVFADNYNKTCPETYSLTVTTTPDTDLGVLIKDTIFTSPKSEKCAFNETVLFGILSPQEKDNLQMVTGVDTKYIFDKWNDDVIDATRTVMMTSDCTYTARMNKVYKIETKTDPENITTVEGSGWYEEGISKNFEAPNIENYSFSYWLINNVNCGNDNPLNVTIDSPKSIVAKYTESNIPPEINIPDQEITENSTLTIDLSDFASDTNGDVLSFEKVSGVGVLEGNIYTYFPGFEDSGIYDVTIRVKDTHDASNQNTFSITVHNLNRKPEFNMLSPEDGLTDVPISTILEWSANDPDRDELFYNCYFGVSATPSIVLMNATTTQYAPITLIHNTDYNWKIEVSDGEATVSSDLMNFTVIEETYSDVSLSIVDGVLNAASSNPVFIHAENLANVSGVQLVIMYDETKFSTPTVTKLNNISSFMGPIVQQNEPGKLLISVASNDSVSLLSEEIFRIDFEVSDSNGITYIFFDGETEVVDDSLNVLPVDISDKGIFLIE